MDANIIHTKRAKTIFIDFRIKDLREGFMNITEMSPFISY